MDWYEPQWWLNATKNGSLKWKNGGRNRTKVYIYPSFGIDEPKPTTVRTSTSPITTLAIDSFTPTTNLTTTDEETLIILPGIRVGNSQLLSSVQLNFQLNSITYLKWKKRKK